jgi:hypothetical protein
MRRVGRIAVALLVVTTVFATLCSAMNSRPATTSVTPKQTLLDPNAPSASSAAASAFAPIRQSGEEAACGSFLPPRLVTVSRSGEGESVFTLDVVVGADGAVESVLILDAEKPGAQARIADRISRWVYKPALCNGIPVASEGRIEVHGE